MRLTALTLRNYGNFADTTLAFDPAPGRINLVLAPNGAGKSVLRGAFGDLLFGIGAQTPMGFRHGYAGMQVLARGISPDGEPFALGRRKGRANTLVDAEDRPVAPAVLARLLGPTDRTLLERLFALDTERLRAGGQGLLASGGALAEALLQAAGGLRPAQDLRLELEAERDKLAPRRKSAQKPFYAALDRLTSSRRLLKDHLVRPDAWQQRERALAEAVRLLEAAQQAARDTAAGLHRMERVRRTRPLLARHDAAAGWLVGHPEAPHLPADLAGRLAAARHAAQQSAEASRVSRRHHAALLEQQAAIAVDHAVLDLAPAVAALQETAGAAARARQDLPALTAALRADEARIEEQLLALGLTGSAADAAGLLPPPPLLARARRLAEAHARQTEAVAELPARIATLEADLQSVLAALGDLPPEEDLEGLAAPVAAITAQGEPVQVAAAALARSTQARARLDSELARLPATLRNLAALRALALPEPAVLRRLAEARDDTAAEARRLEAELSRLDAALQQFRRERKALDRQGALPDAEALAQARARREAGWHLVYRRAFTATPPDAAAEHAFGGAEPLPLAYARAVAEADALADQRLAETARLASAAELDRAIAQHAAALAIAEATAQAASGQAAGATKAWAAALRPAGLGEEAGLTEVEALLARREAALDAGLGLETALAEQQEIETRQAAGRGRLMRALGLDEPAPDLRSLLDRAEARLRDLGRGVARRAALGSRREAAEQALAEARRQQGDAEARRAGWQAEWAEVLRALGRDPAEQPEDAQAALALYDSLREVSAQARERRLRLHGMAADIDAFHAQCRAISLALGGGVPEDCFAAARALDQRRGQEEAARSRLLMLLEQAEAAEREAMAAERLAAEAGAILQGTVAEAGAATPEDAEARIALSLERHRQASEQAMALQALLEHGDGMLLAALSAEAADFPAEALDAALAGARAEQESQQAAIAAAAAEAARLQAEHDALDRDDGLALAAQDQQAAITQIGRTLDDALLMQVAASLLEAALGSVQTAGDDTLLRRIGHVFSSLTKGAYPAVQSREDEKGIAHLLIRRRDRPEEETTVDALSEGTRDQLFLALRLVAIEDHAAGGAPLPFLGDDILQSFDDGRAAAAFQVLLGLSETTQVILLSHHHHLVEVARAALPEGALHLQRIEA